MADIRPRERILANLETIYREAYDRAKNFGDQGRMIDLESAYMRDQLMLEILLDIRDLFSVTPAAPAPGGTALEKLDNSPPPPEPRLQAAAEQLLPRGVGGALLAELEDGWATLLEEEPDIERVSERGARLFAIGAKLLLDLFEDINHGNVAPRVRCTESGGP